MEYIKYKQLIKIPAVLSGKAMAIRSGETPQKSLNLPTVHIS